MDDPVPAVCSKKTYVWAILAALCISMFMLIALLGRSVQSIDAGLMSLTVFSFVSIMPLCVVLAAFAPFEWTAERRKSDDDETKPEFKLEIRPASKAQEEIQFAAKDARGGSHQPLRKMLIYMITARVDAFDRGCSAKANRDGLSRSLPDTLEPGEPIIV